MRHLDNSESYFLKFFLLINSFLFELSFQVLTDKTIKLLKLRKYTFFVERGLLRIIIFLFISIFVLSMYNVVFYFIIRILFLYFFTKPIVKSLFNNLFNVNVISVNILIVRSKKRKLGKFIGYKKVYKKAYVTLSWINSFFEILIAYL